ncbi:hypothetical protein N7539_004517 [Penicillium diatomitis]|uniref:Uncharacterized protein n=1 Tax=Penicillium diatomitis TaxID=2819901 RepID=A0A9X0BYV1_9EURO|nr:uncharacterized protein N7539_004517 [Penicillium diatomitis]KAJ5489627.1 hypothetical protein N7539_004517 [Penicillium diatomitis]
MFVSILTNNTTTSLRAKEIIAASRNVENAPLELEFESIIRRPPAPNTNEWNITFTAKDLTACCDYAFPEALILSLSPWELNTKLAF